MSETTPGTGIPSKEWLQRELQTCFETIGLEHEDLERLSAQCAEGVFNNASQLEACRAFYEEHPELAEGAVNGL